MSRLSDLFQDDPEVQELAIRFQERYPEWPHLVVDRLKIQEYRAEAERGDDMAALKLVLFCAQGGPWNKIGPKTVEATAKVLKEGINFDRAFHALEKETYRDWEGDLEKTHRGRMLTWALSTVEKFRRLVDQMPDQPVVIMPRVLLTHYSAGKTLQQQVRILQSGEHKKYLSSEINSVVRWLDLASAKTKKIWRSDPKDTIVWLDFDFAFKNAVDSLHLLAVRAVGFASLYEGGQGLLQAAQNVKETGLNSRNWTTLPVPKLAGQKLKPVSWTIGGNPPPPAWSDGLEDVQLTYPQALELWRTDLPYFYRDGVSKIKGQEKEAERDSSRAIDQANRYDQTWKDGAGHADPLEEGAQFLREASKLHFQASAELEEAWNKLEAALGHEDELKAAYKRMRQTPRDIEKVFGRSSKSFDNPDFLLAAKAYRRVLDWFLTLDKEHRTALGAADKLTKQARELEDKAAVLFAVSQGRLRAFDTYREAAVRLGPRESLGVEKLTYRVKSETNGLIVAVYDGTRRVGGMSAYKRTIKPAMVCINDILDLVERHPELEDTSSSRWVMTSGFEVPNVNLLTVDKSVIDESVRGRGAGTGMYLATMRAWFDKVGPFLFIPDSCGIVGSTSPEAKRVWMSLSTKFPSSGLVIAVLRRP